MGIMDNPGLTYTMQELFQGEGYLSVKVTPLGANLCLLEDLVEGEIEAFVEEGCDYLKQWFKEVKRWIKLDVDP